MFTHSRPVIKGNRTSATRACRPCRSCLLPGFLALLVSLLALPLLYGSLSFITQGWIHRQLVAPLTGLRYASQNAQDLYLHHRFFQHLRGPGVFVEFGISDGLLNSNSYFFERSLGWRGLCVEPVLEHYQQATLNRPSCNVVHAAIAPVCSHPTVEIAVPRQMGMAALEGTLRAGVVGASGEQVACSTLQDLLLGAGVRHVHLLSMDTEGSELAIMQQFPWAEFVIDVVQVEALTSHAGLIEEMSSVMRGHGYELDAVLDVTQSLATVDLVFARTIRADLPMPAPSEMNAP